MKGKVYLVGAGPGDPELLTLKAHRLIQQADVILYDRLISTEILAHAKPGCECVYVGKKEGHHLIPQQEINDLLVKYGRSYETVVRLKGGDPFIFGRGGEEGVYLTEHHIPFEIVPGISSAVAVPAYAGIPVTMRDVASSFAVITGHRTPKHRNSDLNWSALAGIHTLVFLMGVTERRMIARQLLKAGKSPDEPVAFIEQGTTVNQKVYQATLAEVAQGEPQNVQSPATMVVGQVVHMREKLNWFQQIEHVLAE